MRFSPVPLAACLLACAPAYGLDTLSAGLVRGSYVTSKLTTTPFEAKQVVAARDDAARFIASDGAVRSAYLQAAFEHLRQSIADLPDDDLELAAAILVQ
ncbi:DUF2388 domain-containing protein [Stutzerimonas kirkiae]|uniref:Holliday junction resolvase n=1 Tax=Stutzerimonas kirkiae TaxID=2211392 RepID=A0A4Q9R9U5_9GAMM|nr:DUF2388 domain-containing protein [Stutzerimonas kirkiae]TBU96544.1 Holliday junction resolvase [Stutzerimonas kirkiae]TBV02172.1 Holliday junction resolvase [Stutzerimonas kirkiae]TBV08841.1 Holliday junction resolvase [Stutzerimonas kirkiae]TBV15677.1 Holliday junction resolvase [Stutzerimonas kirkiae]